MNKIVLFLLIFIQTKSFWKNFEIQKLYIKKQKDFLEFLHEFHHFIEINDYGWNLEEMYLVLPKNLIDKKISPSIKKIKTINTSASDYYIKLIKHKLAGYAAEAAFEETSLLLNLLKKENYKKNFYLFWVHNKKVFSKIKDIEEAFEIIKNINIDDPIIKYYVERYKTLKLDIIPNETKKNSFKENEIFIYLTVLVVIYEDLKKSYKSEYHQSKINKIIKNNKNLMSYEIFFYKDLKSLWQKNSLERDLSFENLEENEKAIVANLKN